MIGVELASYRRRAGQTLAAAAKAVGCSSSLVGHFEKGMYFPQPQQIAELLEFYAAPSWDVERLVSLCGRADQRTWLAPWVDVIPDWLRTFVGLEGLATRETIYAPLVLPALVQTEDYATGMTSPSARVRPDQSERLVSLRMERQQRLSCTEDPLRLTALIEESVLDRPIGSAEIMRAQFEHLLELACWSNVEILVLPTSVGRHDGLEGRFTVLDFDAAQSIGYVEIPDGAVYVQDQDQVAGYTRNAEALRSIAHSQEDSLEVIRARAQALV
ncbi:MULTISPECIES: helix-turn-helix transcriptional regulator [unclassified Actinopolyspora]|uniref:helix-turn-helix domain-containing protein n=1 Tax=unclassified Actinopolyspora TaxID=2639451 RepID=UPI001F61DD9A|nr:MULTISPECIES: helix-turn-helix transcriptional regulator [unclassified Actinopolyspora]